MVVARANIEDPASYFPSRSFQAMTNERNQTHRLHQPGDAGAAGDLEFQDVSVVSFDAAGTLITPYPSVGAIYAQALHRHGRAADCSEIERRFRKSLKRNQATVRTDLNNDTERELWRRIVWDTLGEFCPNETFSIVFDELYEEFASGSRWQLAPDARETLTELEKRGYRIALLSNSDSRMRRVLAELNIDHLFVGIFLSSEIGYEKPDYRAFRSVERQLSSTPRRMLHVGDSRRRDAEGARMAGWYFLILDARAGAQDHSIIPSLSSLLALLPGCTG